NYYNSPFGHCRRRWSTTRRGRPYRSPSSLFSYRGNRSQLDVEFLHELRVLLDENSARFDLVAHQRLEDLVGEHRFLDADLEKRATLRIHRRVPELVGIHLAEALVALDVDRAVSVAVAEPRGDLYALGLVVRVVLFAALCHPVQRRL